MSIFLFGTDNYMWKERVKCTQTSIINVRPDDGGDGMMNSRFNGLWFDSQSSCVLKCE